MITKKTVPSRLYLTLQKTLTIPEIPVFARSTLPELHEECIRMGLNIIGPVEFIYVGVSCDPTTLFELTIALPIQAKKATSDRFAYLSTAPFVCACLDYHGSLQGIGEAWNTLHAALQTLSLMPAEQCREVYQHRVDFDSADNITELQLGIFENT